MDENVSKYLGKIARLSHAVVVEKYGKDFYSRIGKLGGRGKWKRQKENVFVERDDAFVPEVADDAFVPEVADDAFVCEGETFVPDREEW